MRNRPWSKNELRLAFLLYCKLPFGRLHRLNPEVIELAALIGRTPSSVAMKLVNLASLDPAIRASGRAGLGNASRADRAVWEEFHADWEGLALRASQDLTQLRDDHDSRVVEPSADFIGEDPLDETYTGETRATIVQQRIKQQFFRRMVLSSYGGKCCMTGIDNERLLLASHIVPWSVDAANRLNPRNGLCLSALHDKAFDRGLIAIADDFSILVSDEIRANENPFIRNALGALEGKRIRLPERFVPDATFLKRHRDASAVS